MKRLHILFVLLCIMGGIHAQSAAWDGTTKTKPTVDRLAYKVSTPAHLAWIADACATDESVKGFEGKEVVIEADLDLGNHEWTPIGTSEHPFKGHVIGNSHTVKNLKITGTKDYVGLFGYVEGQDASRAKIDSLFIRNANISGGNCVGTLCGRGKHAEFSKCAVNTSTLNGASNVGGLVGSMRNSAAFISYVKDATITATVEWAGLFVGCNDTVDRSTLSINNCYAKGKITCAKHGGGFVGRNAYKGKIQHCYCIIQFAGKKAECTNLGLFCAVNENKGVLENCAYNSNLNGNMTSDGVEQNDNANESEVDVWSNTVDNMKSLSFYTNLTNSGNKDKWKQDFSRSAGTGWPINDGTPILAWEYRANVRVAEAQDIQLSVYPNPVQDILYLKAGEGVNVNKVEVMDILGKITSIQENADFVDMSNCKAGIYLIRVTTDNGIVTKKVSKQ